MPDLYQSPTLVTLSNICFTENKKIRNRLNLAIVILIPCHFRHLEDRSILHLLTKLNSIDYISEIIVVINGQQEADNIKDLYKSIDKYCTILCAPRGNQPGKGFALGLGFGYVYQKYQDSAIVTTLDADLRNFTPDFLLKLIYPMTELNADFNKGYYVRYSNNKLDGRLTRLLVFPLLQAYLLQEKNDGLLMFLSEFRYPLSGDTAIKSHLIPRITIMRNWSYDLSMLVELYKNKNNLNLFQTEITQNYQHPHRNLDAESDYSLLGIAEDIINYLKNLYSVNIDVLIQDYTDLSNRFIAKYEKLALFNGMSFNREQEKKLATQIIVLLSNHADDGHGG